jgi:aldose 1-epimerase
MAVASPSSKCFGHLPSGQSVESWTISGSGGLVAEVITYGGILTKVLVPELNGHVNDVVLGFNRLDPYLTDRAYFGAIVGRVAGRIPHARLILEGKTYELTRNEGANHLHGGFKGFSRKLWKATPGVDKQDRPSLRLEYLSQNGEEGYPGSAHVAVTYSVTPENVLQIRSEAKSDQTTPLSLTFHPYFNLGGESSGSVAGHELQIHADDFVAVDENMTLLDDLKSVTGDNDFRCSRNLGDAIPKLFRNHGDLYRIRRMINPEGLTGPVPAARTGLASAARLIHQPSGRAMDISTTATYLQLYTGVGLDGTLAGKQGASYERYAGLCLECEGYPNGANHPAMGDILLYPGKARCEVTEYAFNTLRSSG